jgi:ATP-dependent DNA ligase
MNVNQIFEDLAANNSRLFKLDYLKQHKDNEVLKRAIFLALDPFTQFYIRKIPPYTHLGNMDITLAEAMNQLIYLANRVYTGNKGIGHLQSVLSSIPSDSAKVIERIIKKDLKCGVSVATVNEIWPGLIHEYPCMLCSGYEEKIVQKIQYPAYVQLKMDGMRFNAIVRSGEVEFRSRNGKEIELLGFLEDEFKAMAGGIDLVFDGELTVVQDGAILDRQTGNGILNKASKGTISKDEAAKVHATVWDAIPYEYFKEGYYNRKYSQRFSFVENCVHHVTNSTKVKVVESTKVNSLQEAHDLFGKYYAEGQEGIILKSEDGIWENKRSKSQIKFKGELECDLIVVGVEEGRGKYQGKIGALIAESSDGLVKVSVGSGLTDELRGSLLQENVVGRIITVKYNARIKNKQGDHSLFLPIFIELRLDKDEADSSKDIK